MLLFYLQKLDSESDRILFDLIYEEYQQQMYQIAYRFLSNIALAEECVNDAFLELIKSFDTFAKLEKKKQPYYLFTITERCAYRKYNQEKKQRDLKWTELETFVADNSSNTETSIMIKRAIGLLPIEYQYPLLLRYAQDQTYEEIASVLGISVSNARQRVKRAKDKLAVILQEKSQDG